MSLLKVDKFKELLRKCLKTPIFFQLVIYTQIRPQPNFKNNIFHNCSQIVLYVQQQNRHEILKLI